MENSIEVIWKEGFLNEKSLVAPKVNDLYNQKSKHLVDKIKRMFRINFIAIVIMAVVFPVIHYFMDALLEGIAASVLLLLTAWYGQRQLTGIHSLDQGATSLEYLKSFDRWLNEVVAKNRTVVRFSYPLYLIIAFSTILSAWNSLPEPSLSLRQKFPNLTFVGNVPLVVFIIAALAVILMFIFSDRIYRWDVNLVYGRIFRRLKKTISEMEELRKE
jgi:hypothetical protein